MEIVGLTDNSKQILIRSASKLRIKKKRKRKRSHKSVLNIDDLVSPSTIDSAVTECDITLKHDTLAGRGVRMSRSHHKDLNLTRRNDRSRVMSRSPSRRHRSPARMRSPFKKSRSPILHNRSPVLRRSPRRPRSPKRSPYHSPIPRKVSRIEQSLPSHTYVNVHGNVNKLLKKVRQLDSVGTHSLETNINRNKERALSLKEKLCNMMRGISDNNENIMDCPKENCNIQKKEENDVDDDDEDLALLRQKALETKQRRYNKHNDHSNSDTEKKSTKNNDDHDEEDLELRVIALRSAVLKKHQNRVQRGIKSGGTNKKASTTRSESPFNQSFLDSIPIPGEECTSSASPPRTPSNLMESIHAEDMELDTDIEREKEKLPYSPTDKITSNIPIDTELLGIQPSDVSFISLNEANNSSLFNVARTRIGQETLHNNTVENINYLPNIMEGTRYYSSERSAYETLNRNILYSPVVITETCRQDCNDVMKQNSHMSLPSETQNALKSTQTRDDISRDVNLHQDTPYSPTDTPTYDSDLSPPFQFSVSVASSSNLTVAHENRNSQLNNHEPLCSSMKHKLLDSREEDRNFNELTTSTCPDISSETASHVNYVSPNESMITINDLPETDTDGNPKIVSSKYIQNLECIQYEALHETGTEIVQEPSYMQGVPDVTKDINKIPTLINRTLVPAPILKSNKQLQQPLPLKKYENHVEPTFKSAEMQPVPTCIESNIKSSTTFKPIKLTPFTKKTQSILTTSNAFDSCLNDDSIPIAPKTAFPSSLEYKDDSIVSTQSTADITTAKIVMKGTELSSHKKRKRSRRGSKLHTDEVKNVNMKQFVNNEKAENVLKGEQERTCQTKLQDNKIHEKSKGREHLSGNASHDSDNRISDDVSTKSKDINAINKTGQASDLSGIDDIKEDTRKKNPIHCSSIHTGLNMSSDNTQNLVKVKETETRRQSLDEDADELRAILLASLPKRTKSLDSHTCITAPVTTSMFHSDTKVCSQKISSESSFTTNMNYNTASNPIPVFPLESLGLSVPAGDKSTANIGTTSTNISQRPPCDVNVENMSMTSTLFPAKKRLTNAPKGLPKKITRKISIPASTKVVNNAKKYQNTRIQRRLASQKVANLYNIQKSVENKFLCNVKTNENKWSANLKTSMLSDMQRIVINLESDTESESESEKQKAHLLPSLKSTNKEKHQTLTIPTTEFEKSIDQFLRDVRKKQESAAAAATTTKPPLSPCVSKKGQAILTEGPNLQTPLAVRHLPVSQQEEYRRLKQQIIERERLKLQTKGRSNSGNQATQMTSHGISCDTSNKGQLDLKQCQNIVLKYQSSPQQSLQENNLKNADICRLKSHVANDQICSNKIPTLNNVKEASSPRLQIATVKETMKTMENLSVCIANDISSLQNVTYNKAVKGSSINKKQKIQPESTISTMETVTKASLPLQILTKDELNHKYVQVQVKQNTSGRVVTINEKGSNNNTSSNSVNNVIIENHHDIFHKNVTNNNTHASLTPVVHKLDESINNGNNETVDSNASTLLLSPENRTTYSEEDYKVGESTLELSQDTEQRDDTLTLSGKIDNSCSSISDSSTTCNNEGSFEEIWETIRKDVKAELHVLINLPQAEQKQHLMDTEHKLVMKRYTVLEDLAEMAGNLRQWDIERDLQMSLVAEVKRLREQLKIAEERLQLQRNRINNLGPKVMKKVMVTREKINEGRQECFKLLKICSVLGVKLNGQNYKVPEAGAQLLNNKLKEVANNTRQLSRKRIPFINIPDICVTSVSQNSSDFAAQTDITERIEENSLLKDNNHDINVPIIPNEGCQMHPIEEEEVKKEKEEVTQLNDMVSNDNEVNLQEKSNMAKASSLTNEENKTSSSSEQKLSTMEPSLCNNPITLSEDCESENWKQPIENSEIKTSTSLINSGVGILKQTYEQHSRKFIEPYVSMLMHLKMPRNTNPNGVLCPYELMGTCSDGDCQFVHQTSHV